MVGALHDDEIPIDLELVRGLVARALPAFASLPLRSLGASGSSNALFRLGAELLVRLPRQPGGSATIEKEARWLPVVASALPVSVPQIVAVGEPDLGYPERWSVVRWLDGHAPAVIGPEVPNDPARRQLAMDLASVIAALRQVRIPEDATGDPDLRWYRGSALSTQDAATRQAIEECRSLGVDIDLDAALKVWEQSLTVPEGQQTSAIRWYHGDLFAENLLVDDDGRLVGILDFGGLAVGDPTVDLIVAWEVLDPPSRARFQREVRADQESWLRGRAWALSLAVRTFPYYWRTMPERCASRLTMLRSVLADADAGDSWFRSNGLDR